MPNAASHYPCQPRGSSWGCYAYAFCIAGLGYIAAVLEKEGYQVDVIDCQVLNLSMEDFRSEIEKRKPNIIGVTSSTLTYNTAMKLVKIARRVLPKYRELVKYLFLVLFA